MSWFMHLSVKEDFAGSIPAPGAPDVREENCDPGQLLLVVTPRFERGGRWFDSSPRNSLGLKAKQGPGTPTAERPVLNTGECGFDSRPGHLGSIATTAR